MKRKQPSRVTEPGKTTDTEKAPPGTGAGGGAAKATVTATAEASRSSRPGSRAGWARRGRSTAKERRAVKLSATARQGGAESIIELSESVGRKHVEG